MTNEETIFAAALGHGSATERGAYLDEACAGDAELRRAVEAHLAHNDDGSLSRASRATTSADSGDGRVPDYP